MGVVGGEESGRVRRGRKLGCSFLLSTRTGQIE